MDRLPRQAAIIETVGALDSGCIAEGTTQGLHPHSVVVVKDISGPAGESISVNVADGTDTAAIIVV